jgi:hypothetical protein
MMRTIVGHNAVEVDLGDHVTSTVKVPEARWAGRMAKGRAAVSQRNRCRTAARHGYGK